jgi:uncharacterized phage-associated protein
MNVPAQLVAAAIREHLPGVTAAKMHKLLYYVQGHHLALTGHSAFVEDMVADDHGPAVASFVDDPTVKHVKGTLSLWVLNVAGLVAARYGRLTTRELCRLTRTETPWQRARVDRRPISAGDLVEFFTGEGSQDPVPDPFRDDPEHQRRLAREVNRIRAGEPAKEDTLGDIRAEVARHVRR